MEQENLKSILNFVEKAENLKNTLRYSHTSKGRQESSAEHSWRLGLLVMVLSAHFDKSDREKMLKLALIHDLGESITGDVPAPQQGESGEKSLAEQEAMRELCAGLPDGLRHEILTLWDEYETGASLEARLVRGLDKLETIMQHNQGKNPPDFDYHFNLSYGRDYTDVHPLLEQIRARLDRRTAENAQEKSVQKGVSK